MQQSHDPAFDQYFTHQNELGKLLDRKELCVDPEQSELDPSLVGEMKTFIDPILDGLEAGFHDVVHPDDRNLLLSQGSTLVGEVAAILHLNEEHDESRALIERALRTELPAANRDELEAAVADMATFTQLLWARWLQRNGQPHECKAVAKSLIEGKRHEVYVKAARSLLLTHWLTLQKKLATQLDEPDFEPDPTRKTFVTDQSNEASPYRQSALMTTLKSDAEEMLDAVADGVLEGSLPQDRDVFKDSAASLVGEVSVYVHLAGDPIGASQLLSQAIDIAPPGKNKEELISAKSDMAAFVTLTWAKWLQRHQQFPESDRVLKKLRRATKVKEIRRSAQEWLNTSRPINGAPPLFRINGCGVGLYGARAHGNDGSYISTLCLSLLFIPVFPLASYRVANEGTGQYLFFSKERLSPFARWYRYVVGIGALAAIAIALAASWLGSSSHQASVALRHARSLEASGQSSMALLEYEDIAQGYYPSSAREEALEGFARMAKATVVTPVDLSKVDEINGLVLRYRRLSTGLSSSEADDLFARSLVVWVDQLGSADEVHARKSLDLLRAAELVAPHNTQSLIREKTTQIRRGLIVSLADDWPLQAMEQVGTLPLGEMAATLGAPIVRSIIDSPSLLLEAENDVRTWARSCRQISSEPELVQLLEERLQAAAAMSGDGERREALRSGDVSALTAVLERFPGDQEATVARANALRAGGDIDGAVAMLSSLGRPGYLIPDAQRALAMLYADSGRLEEADTLLTRIVDNELSPFQDVQRRYADESRRITERFISNAEMGIVPEDLESRLATADEQGQSEIIREHIQQILLNDSRLTSLRQEYEQRAQIVPAVLALGMVKLRRANEATGAERQRLLSTAEELFLSIQSEAEGLPEYHLALGQVYHRLGKRTEGERELDTVLTGTDEMLKLSVSEVYRELGAMDRAKTVALSSFETGSEVVRGSAAQQLALLSIDLDERESWFRKAPQNEFVTTSLLEIDASRHYRKGELAQADALFARVAQGYGKNADANPSAANNAALAMQDRYKCTGRTSHLDEAVESLSKASRNAPDNALILGNLAHVELYRGAIEVLDRHVETEELLMDAKGTMSALFALSRGPLHQELTESLRHHPSLRKGLDVIHQTQILSPQFAELYSLELFWLELMDDTEAVRSLSGRLRHVETLNQGEAEGSDAIDAQERATIDEHIERTASMVERVRRSRHKQTIALAYIIHGGALARRGVLNRSTTDVELAVDALRQADEHWNGAGAWLLARTLADLAVLRAQELSGALRYELERSPTSRDLPLLAYLALQGGSWDEVARALRQQPELRQATELLRTLLPHHRPTYTDWIIAQLAEDTELVSQTQAVLESEPARLALEIEARLEPSSEADQRLLEILRSSSARSSNESR